MAVIFHQKCNNIYSWDMHLCSPHDEHQSSGPKPVKLVQTSKFLSFHLDIYKINSKI